jgi:predicted dehydrogenase
MFGAAVRQHPQARLIAVCEPAPEVSKGVQARLCVPVYSDVETMLAQHPELNAVVIATPDFAHREAAQLCAEAGLDLMIEKPLATSVEDAEAIVRAARISGARVMVGFENRWNPKFAAVRQQLAASEPDTVISQIANLNDTIFVPTKMLSWAARSSPAWFLMPHTLDLAMWLSGATPVEVFARGTRGMLSARGVDTWDAITASIAMSDGSLVVLNSQWILPETMPAVFDFRYELHTHQASYRFDISDNGVMRYDHTGAHALQFGVHETNGRLRGAPIDMVNDFLALAAGAAMEFPDGDHGLRVTRTLEAVHTSLLSGKPESAE